MSKLEQPALHRKQIREGLMTEEESKRIMDKANYEDSVEEEEEEDNRYPYGD